MNWIVDGLVEGRMSLLNVPDHYPKVPGAASVILGPLQGLVYVTAVTMAVPS